MSRSAKTRASGSDRWCVASYDRLRDLPLKIESYEFEGHELRFSPEFERLTTEIQRKLLQVAHPPLYAGQGTGENP